jgi:hypothetical protein
MGFAAWLANVSMGLWEQGALFAQVCILLALDTLSANFFLLRSRKLLLPTYPLLNACRPF